MGGLPYTNASGSMKTITVIMIILFIIQVGAQETGSSLSKIRQKRSWVVEIYTIKRGFVGQIGHVEFYDNIKECKIYGPGLDQQPKGLFLIDKLTKNISVTGNVDYGDRKNFTLIFECAALKHVYERLAVQILIEEVYEPYLSKGTYVISAEEWMQQGTPLLTMLAPSITNPKGLIFNVKVTPNPHTFMVFINEKQELSLRGCLDYEENEKYTVVVEVKDQKVLTPHSSTATVIINIIDKNDNIPVIIGRKGNGQIKEREIGSEVYRIQVSDKDSPGSPAWRAKFTLSGHQAENFKMELNPETNEGILSVIKQLDYEKTQKLNLTAEVENEEPFFSCSVQTMYYDGKQWDVVYSKNGSISTKLFFPITVENVNDPPEFIDTIKHVTVMENTPPGRSLWTFSVTDQDENPPNTHRFIKGKDIDNWVTIDPKTGTVSTAKVLDRESEFVKENTYTVILHAVDDGTPLQTGTGTLIIQLLDENDNAPFLKVNDMTICLLESKNNITAIDLDLPPFSSPFTYEIQDNKGKWRIEPSYGETVTLVKGPSVYSGSYELILNITDSGGLSSRQKLSVTVRNCADNGRSYTTQAGAHGISVIFICFFVMLCILLMIFECSCYSYTEEKKTFPEFEDSDIFMRCYNEEGPGNDVEMALRKEFSCPPKHRKGALIQQKGKIHQKHQQVKKTHFEESWEITEKRKKKTGFQKDWTRYQEAQNMKYTVTDDSSQLWTILGTMIEKKLFSLCNQEQELCDYKPHLYNNEGEPGDLVQLDSISVAESHFSLGDLEPLGPKFQRLAAQCRPDLVQHSYMSQTSVSSHQYQHWHQHQHL